ncbi:SMI1/KNR4 family protein [Streptacidiphilus fuscans]|uniref:Knr4/Smi1-like domain-containing protein n=1 Tax=Streptacidiphilus fuscans TaxID=2789292 RepID=A0A931FG56_9ACTN|nr:hypothetical protein [Streptacidiphilus fuscans]MBF9073562.1 hypothetical protein [Streptacidiphilus fuscans]
MHPSVDRLSELMPPRPGSGDLVDWDVVAERWGLRFPTDYRDFVALYGAGSLNNSFHVGIPVDAGTHPDSPLTLTTVNESGFGLLGLVPGEDPDLTNRLSWAMDWSGNHVFWDTTDPDPDTWPVMVLARHGEWLPFEGRSIDFIISLLTHLDEGWVGVIASDRPMYMHWREEQQIRAVWEDPWPHLR